MLPNPIPPMPPAMRRGTIARIPRRCLEDAAQEAWVAHLCGHDPNAAVWAYVKRVRRREARMPCFSQLEPRQYTRIFREAAAE